MKTLTLTATCHFGLETVLKHEIYDLGYEPERVTDGRVTFTGDAEAIVRANLCLRTAERVLLNIGEFEAESFEDLFRGIKALPWEAYLPKTAKFWVTKATSVKSALHSIPDIQSVAKKAMVERMKDAYRKDIFPETGAAYPVRLFLLKDKVTATLDTSGETLHKRGYRTLTAKAPLSETMAAALLSLTPWHDERILYDPFCGSGTFLIEAALMAAHIAPGLSRTFVSEDWENLIPPALWKEIRTELKREIIISPETNLFGSDRDPAMIEIAKKNADRAGVLPFIHFETTDIAEVRPKGEYGFLLTNPPYGERLLEKDELPRLYKSIGALYQSLPTWSLYFITSYEDAERMIGRRADKNRKLYNGMLKTYFYQYRGPKP